MPENGSSGTGSMHTIPTFTVGHTVYTASFIMASVGVRSLQSSRSSGGSAMSDGSARMLAAPVCQEPRRGRCLLCSSRCRSRPHAK